MKKEIIIDDVIIGPEHPPYVIAEISGNHNGDIERAKTLIRLSKEVGASAVKLQNYTPDSLTIDTQDERFTLKEGTWAGKNLYQLYKESCTPYEWFPELFSYAKSIGITIFSSPFDLDGVDFLEKLNVPAYKIASNEMADWPLVEKVAKTGKPMIISTGTSSWNDITKTVSFIKDLGVSELVVLHCVSAYPAMPEDSNLKTMKEIEKLGVMSGLSDHTLGTATSVAAVALGARVIEKHVTLDRNDGGPDSSFSLEPEELKLLCHDTEWAWKSLGGVKFGGDTNLKKKGIFTRQFWAIEDIKKGETLSYQNIKSIRAPADAQGVATMEYKTILGATCGTDISKHNPVKLENIIKRG